MLWALPLLPLLAGPALWLAAPRVPCLSRRRPLAWAASAVLAATLGLALWATAVQATAGFHWGPALSLQLRVTPEVSLMACLVVTVAWAVILWGAAHEQAAGLPRLIGLLVAFVGAMQLLVLSADLLSLSCGFELVGALSWALIGQRADDPRATRAAAYAFNAVRIGGVALLLSAAAALARNGSLQFEQLPEVARSSWGSWLCAGVLIAALAKSAQLPFSPWLFRAMQGPTAASALLHSSTMVAAGAWILIRLQPALAQVPWFAPCVLGVGLTTALLGGLTACAQPHIKKLLAASTSAHYGLMLVAVGAGAPGVALAHLVAHALFKALLFLCAGEAISATGSHALHDMRLGRVLPWTAAASAAGTLALAAVPPLGAAWTKEQVIASTEPLGAGMVGLVTFAGALSAAYAARFQLLAFGWHGRRHAQRGPGIGERAPLLALAIGCLLLGALWLPRVQRAIASALAIRFVPAGLPLSALSVGASLLAIALVALADRRHGRSQPAARWQAGQRTLGRLSDWGGVPALIEHGVSRPLWTLAHACARYDQRVVDGGVRASAALARALARAGARGSEPMVRGLISAAVRGTQSLARAGDLTDRAVIDPLVRGVAGAFARAARVVPRAQTGAVPVYYLMIVCGLFVLGVLGWIGR